MTDRNPSQRTEPKGGAPVPVKVKDHRAGTRPQPTPRHRETGRFVKRNGGRRSQ
jgi:hypothetical protein